MKLTATKIARVPFTKTFECEDEAAGFLEAEDDWSKHGGTGWTVGNATFGPTEVEQAAEVVSTRRKPTRERVWAKS